MQNVVPVVTYQWYGQEVRIDLATCREALVRNLMMEGAPPTMQAFAKRVGLSDETVYKLFRGEKVGRRSLLVIVNALGLRPEQVIQQVAA